MSSRDPLTQVVDRLGRAAQRQHPLGALTTYRVGGPAAVLVEVAGEDDLHRLVKAIGGRQVPLLLLGRGSNMLVADRGFPGLVVRPTGALAELVLPSGPDGTDDPAVVRVGAALELPKLARRTVEAGWSGLEWSVGVPGSVGGAVRMNAGGHGSDIAASLVRCRVVDLSAGVDAAGDGQGAGAGAAELVAADALALGYRSSSLAAHQAVVWAELRVEPGAREEGRAMLSEIVRWRREHQPGGSNAGSVFTNPDPAVSGGLAAAELIDRAGLKGYRVGSAQVSPKHANFIQADAGGSANDVYSLMEHVRMVVAERSGVVLRTEVCLVGFDDEQTDGGSLDDQASGSPGAER